MNTTASRDSGIFRAVTEYGKSINVHLPPPTSPTADRVASQLFPTRDTVPTTQSVDLYHQSLQNDMDLYIELVDEAHREEVKKIIDRVLDFNKAWFNKKK